MSAHASRRDALREVVRTRQLGAMLVSNPTNVRYLTGFTGSNGALLLGDSPRADRLVTDFRYVTQAAAECAGLDLVVERSVVPAGIAYAVSVGAARVGIEADHVTVATHTALRDAHRDLHLEPTQGVVEALRLVKDDSELDLLAEACRVTDAGLQRLLSEVRVGSTEREIARALEGHLMDCGADALAFETIVATGPHSAIPHHSPTTRPVARGDLLKIDFGALVGGYHADETRTFVVGAEPELWQRDLHALVLEAQRAGIAALRVGAEVRDVDQAARSVIAAAGHGEHFGHGLGHGVGLDIHEAPLLSHASTGILGDRTPVTVEPGVYLPGLGGVRIEDTLVVLADGPVSLTSTTRELLVLG